MDTMIRQIQLIVLLFAAVSQTGFAAQDNWRSPESVEGAITTTLEQAKGLHESGTVFIDVRNPRLYALGHIPAAYHLDLKNGFDEAALMALADKNDAIVIYCSGVKCSRSYRAAALAVNWGYQKVHYFRGGIVEWMKLGFPVVKGDARGGS